MRFSKCDTPLPECAVFCVECGAPLRAATGTTVALGPGRPPLTVLPSDLPVVVGGPGAEANAARHHGSFLCGGQLPFAHELSLRSGAIFIIGLTILIVTGNVWPWILLLIGVIGAADELGSGKVGGATMTMVFLAGLAVLFATGTFWPGFLVLIGIGALLHRK